MFDTREAPPRRLGRRLLGVAGAVAFVGFWTYALFFSSKEAINRVGDREWAARAEQICATSDERREGLIDLRRTGDGDAALLAEKAALVDRATDIVHGMLDDVVAVEPSDDKGRAIVPDWTGEYRTYLRDRRQYADRLRAGDDAAFAETAVEGIPISERLETFANDNEMPSCAPPKDLSQ